MQPLIARLYEDEPADVESYVQSYFQDFTLSLEGRFTPPPIPVFIAPSQPAMHPSRSGSSLPPPPIAAPAIPAPVTQPKASPPSVKQPEVNVYCTTASMFYMRVQPAIVLVGVQFMSDKSLVVEVRV